MNSVLRLAELLELDSNILKKVRFMLLKIKGIEILISN